MAGTSNVAVLQLVLFALCCGPRTTPEQEIELLRSHYQVRLRSLVVKQDPVIAARGGSDGSGAALAAPVVRSDAILDLLVSTTDPGGLPGLTVDVEQLDAQRRPKDHRRLWVDTSALAGAEAAPVTQVLENVDWDTGDAFTVQVRSPIPAAERTGYQEFEAGPP